MNEATEVIQEALAHIRMTDMLPDNAEKAMLRADDMCRIYGAVIHLGIGGKMLQDLAELGEEDVQMAASVLINLQKMIQPAILACLTVLRDFQGEDQPDVQ